MNRKLTAYLNQHSACFLSDDIAYFFKQIRGLAYLLRLTQVIRIKHPLDIEFMLVNIFFSKAM